MFKSYNCESLEEAIEKFPELKDVLAVKINCLDGDMVLFLKEELTQEEVEALQALTRQKISDFFRVRLNVPIL